MPSMCSHGSSSKRSSTPQLKAPWAPPPCSAKSIRTGARPVMLVISSLRIRWRFTGHLAHDSAPRELSAQEPNLAGAPLTQESLWQQIEHQQVEANVSLCPQSSRPLFPLLRPQY